MSREHHRSRFPIAIARFAELQGGQYGTIDLLALTRHDLEVRMGGDYVEFPRSRVLELRNALDRFLELGEGDRDRDRDRDRERDHERDRDSDRPHHHRPPSDGRVEVVAKVEERVEERVEEEVRERGTRRKRA